MPSCQFCPTRPCRKFVSRSSTITMHILDRLKHLLGVCPPPKRPRQGPLPSDLRRSSEYRRIDTVGGQGGNPPLPPHMPEEQPSVYCASIHPGRLWQGEILENLPQWKLTHDGIAASAAYPGPEHEVPEQIAIEVMPIDHHFVIVISQDCDLVQDFEARAAERESLLNLLLCDAFPEAEAHARFQNLPDRWQKLKHNQMDRYQFLQAIAPQEDMLGQGLTALVMDFKDHFTLPTAEVYERLIAGTGRRSRLLSPYLEHMIHRFYNFQSRVALPRDHVTGPAA